MTIDIATCRSRTDRKWKNVKMEWDQIRERCQKTTWTAETLPEYLKMTKDRQSEIKDVGGYVGGFLTGGIRKTGHVRHRQLLTLDIDEARDDFWDTLELVLPQAALIYSTHKHEPESPRLRLVMPLARPVSEEEYEPLARRVAADLGIAQFDHTTYQPTRLMYWPSTSRAAEFVYRDQDGPWLSPDQVLATYTDWTDSSSWPVSDQEAEQVHRGIKRAGDPLEKPGVVGAFCRTYPVQDAIAKYLPTVYEATDQEDRYTFAGGSTAGGLVIYDDKFTYSHHGTDPTSNQLCNAFDLVRINLFGAQDEGEDDRPMNRRTSYLEMTRLAMEDDGVRRRLGEERLAASRADFQVEDGEEEDAQDADTPAPEKDGGDWLTRLELTQTGQYKRTIENIVIILENDPRLKGRLIRDAFLDKEVIKGQIPWRKVTHDTRYFSDKDITGLRHYLERRYQIDHKQKTLEGVEVVFGRRSFHPVREYLLGTAARWDGHPRIDSLLVDYLGAEDTAYTRAVTRKALTAACSRIMEPGCKFDHILTLVGPQGVGKSTLLSRLGRDWYCENLTTVQGKEAAEQLRGVWIMEMGELAGLKKAEVEVIKNFISRQEDSYRPAYGIKKETYPRQCVFFGTTNTDDFLRDATGNRRFWPVPVGIQGTRYSVFKDLNAYTVGQIWAEAMEAYKADEPLYLDQETEAQARDMQKRHNEKDARTELIKTYLETRLPDGWPEMDIYKRRGFLQGDELQGEGTVQRTTVSVAEIWMECLGGHVKDMTNNNTKPLHDILKQLPDWARATSKSNRGSEYGKQNYYVRKGSLDDWN